MKKQTTIILALLIFFTFYGIDNVLRSVFSLFLDQIAFNILEPFFRGTNNQPVIEKMNMYMSIYTTASIFIRIFLSAITASLLVRKITVIVDFKKTVFYSAFLYLVFYGYYLNGNNWSGYVNKSNILDLIIPVVIFFLTSFLIFQKRST